MDCQTTEKARRDSKTQIITNRKGKLHTTSTETPKELRRNASKKKGGGVRGLDGLRRRAPRARVRLRNPEGPACGVCRNCGRGYRARHLLRLSHGLVRQPAHAFYEAADGVSRLVDASGDAGVALEGLRVQGAGAGTVWSVSLAY